MSQHELAEVDSVVAAPLPLLLYSGWTRMAKKKRRPTAQRHSREELLATFRTMLSMRRGKPLLRMLSTCPKCAK